MMAEHTYSMIFDHQ